MGSGKWGESEQRYLCILQCNLLERKMLETIFILLALIETNGYGVDGKIQFFNLISIFELVIILGLILTKQK